ncbi:MAG: flavodoxin family protein [Acidimicrobiia bacterium]
MRSLLVCASRSHGNTAKVARAMGDVLGADVVDVSECDPSALADYDLVGFGSGIYAMSFDDELRRLVGSLPPGRGANVFIFATSGFGRINERPFRRSLAAMLAAADYHVVDSFCCRGLDTWLPLRLLGGINRGHPDEADLGRARDFATRLRDGRRAGTADRATP